MSTERIQQLHKLLEMDRRDADVMYMLAQEHAKREEWGEAISWYDRCLESDPAYTYAHFHRARAFEGDGDIASARDALRAGLEAAREHGDEKALGEIGMYLEQLGDDGEDEDLGRP